MLGSEIKSQSWPTVPSLDDTSIPKFPPPASSRGHARSRTTIDIPPLLPRRDSQSPTRSSTYLPFISTSRSPSPKRSATPAEAAEFEVEEGAEQRQKPTRTGRKVESIASWFEGSSEPVNIGLVASPKKEEESEGSIMETMFSGSQESIHSVPTPQKRPIMQSANSSTSRLSFFGRRQSTIQSRDSAGDLASLSITEALFPDGLADESSPAAFKNLQQNAEGALRLFQTAYGEHLAALRKITTEKNVQADELEASNTRNEHLKVQLLEMAERAAQQEKLISFLQAENEQLRTNESALKSIRVITDHTSPDHSATINKSSQTLSRRNRTSDMSFADSLDSAVTDISTDASIFSNDRGTDDSNRSPGTSVGCPSPTLKHACRVITPSIQRSEITEHLKSLTTHIVSAECQKCHGMRPNEAWEVVSVIQAENAGLKERIMELQEAQESASDLLTWRPHELDEVASKCQRMLSVRHVDD